MSNFYEVFIPHNTLKLKTLSEDWQQLMGQITTEIAEIDFCATQFEPTDLQQSDFYAFNLSPPPFIHYAAAKRKSEFFAGRLCTQTILNKLNINTAVAFDNENHCPIWPTTLIGSISHHSSMAIVAIANKTKYQALGIDIEHWLTAVRTEKLASHILTNNEIRQWQQANQAQQIQWLTLAFSAKESLFKALYPLTKQKFYFHDAMLDFDSLTNHQITIYLTKDLSTTYHKKWHGLVNYYQTTDEILTLITH